MGRASSERRMNVQSFATGDLKAKRLHQRHEISFAPVAEQVQAWRGEGHRVDVVAVENEHAGDQHQADDAAGAGHQILPSRKREGDCRASQGEGM